MSVRGTRLAALAPVLYFLTVLLSPACGRKTAVRPPELVAPAAINDLAAANAVAGIDLGWRRPRQTADGKALLDLDAFVVERALPGLPFAFLTRVPVSDRDRLRQQKRFAFVDTTAEMGQDYRYRILALTEDGYFSASSNVVEIVRQMPTATPTVAPTPSPTPVE